MIQRFGPKQSKPRRFKWTREQWVIHWQRQLEHALAQAKAAKDNRDQKMHTVWLKRAAGCLRLAA